MCVCVCARARARAAVWLLAACVVLVGTFAVTVQVVATTLSPAASAMALFMWRRWKRMPYSLNDIANSALAGLVSITAPCATVSPWAAFVIGGA